MRPITNRLLLPLVCLLVLCAASARAANSAEAKIWVITWWPANSGPCNGNDAKDWDDMTLPWYDEIDASVDFFKDGIQIDGWIDRADHCDPDAKAPCADYKYVDDADAALLGLHGADVKNHWAGLMRYQSGYPDCFIHAAEGASTDAMFLGDNDLEFLHLSSGNSMDDDNLNHTWRLFEDKDSPQTGNRLHQANGFHGSMVVDKGFADNYEDFADDADFVAIADAWNDNHSATVPNTPFKQCPVSYAIGATATSASYRLNTERYNNILSDPGELKYIAYQYFEDCFPFGEFPFLDPNAK